MVLEAMAYQVAKCIGEMFAVLKGNVDAILITGELAYNDFVVKVILEHVEKFAPTFIYAGDNEIKAMAANAVRVIKGEMEVKTYS
jgi:butyrate kinase